MYTIDHCYGMMPNQADGILDGKPFYFRARHGSWRLEVGEPGTTYETAPDGAWNVIAFGDDDAAGWWEPDVHRKFVEELLSKYGT